MMTTPTKRSEATSAAKTQTNTEASTLILIRHGERADQVSTDPWYSNRQPRRRDPPLTSQGRAQANKAAIQLQADKVHCTHINTSPLTRCLQTAAELAQRQQVPVKVIYSLGKSCKYFRNCQAKSVQPQVPDACETLHILRDVYPKVVLLAYVDDDGRSCEQALQACVLETMHMAADALPATPASQLVTVVAGHCESQLELSRICGFALRRTPFCGRSIFSLRANTTTMQDVKQDEQDEQGVQQRQQHQSLHWKLIETPNQHIQRKQQRGS